MLHATAWRETPSSFKPSRAIMAVAMVAKRQASVFGAAPVLSAFQPAAVLDRQWRGQDADPRGNHGHTPAGRHRADVRLVHERAAAALLRAKTRIRCCTTPTTWHCSSCPAARAAGALRRFEWTLLRETGYGVDEAAPDFDDPAIEPGLRRDLRERLAEILAGRPLHASRAARPAAHLKPAAPWGSRSSRWRPSARSTKPKA